MHSGKLNSTQLNSSVQFPAVHLTGDDSATKLAIVAGSSQSGHNIVSRPINAVSVIGRKPATTDDGRRRFFTVKNLRRSSPLVAGSLHSGKLN